MPTKKKPEAPPADENGVIKPIIPAGAKPHGYTPMHVELKLTKRQAAMCRILQLSLSNTGTRVKLRRLEKVVDSPGNAIQWLLDELATTYEKQYEVDIETGTALEFAVEAG